MEKRYKFRRVNETIGAFVLLLLLLGLAALILTWQAQRFFWPPFSFDVVLPEEGAFGLASGSQALVMGISAGWVDEIRVKEDGRIMARIKIRRDFRRFIRTDSIAALERQFAIAGDAYLNIEPGEGELLPRNAELAARPPEELFGDLREMLAALQQDGPILLKTARGTLEEWQTLGSELVETQERLREALVRVEAIAGTIQKGEGALGRMLQDPELATRLQNIMNQFERGTARLPDITESIAVETEHLSGLLLQAEQTLREIEIFFDGLQDHWLWRRYMDPGEPPGRIPPGRVEGGRR
jgi:phospholipid/cholesterol/gamma-HCH transport system substrate-binding protein